MKKNIMSYYAIIMLILYLIYNIGLNSLKIGGVLYQIIMIVLVIINAIILVSFRKSIKYKEAICIIYFFTWLFSKNIPQCFFNFSNIIILTGISLFESKLFMKVFAFIITLIVSIFFLPFYFIFIMCFGISMSEESDRNDIYDDMHYYCDNNYEVYSFSQGAIDRFHYSIGKYYEILNIDDIIYVSYNERREVSQEEYENYLNTHNCKLVGDINGSE